MEDLEASKGLLEGKTDLKTLFFTYLKIKQKRNSAWALAQNVQCRVRTCHESSTLATCNCIQMCINLHFALSDSILKY